MKGYNEIIGRHELEQIQKVFTEEDNVLFDAIADKVEKRAEHKQILKSDHAYADPTTNRIWVGETQLPSGVRVATFKTPVRDMEVYNKFMELGKYKNSYKDKAKYDSFEPEFVEDYKIYDGIMKKVSNGELNFHNAQVAVAGTMTMSDFSGMRLIDVLGAVLNNQQKSYSLQNAGTKQQTRSIVFRIPSVDRFEIASELGEHETIEAMQMAFSAEVYQIKKDMAHIAWSDEFEMVGNFDLPIMSLTIQNATSDFERVRALKVAQVILNGTDQAVTDEWDIYETNLDRSKRNPAYDFHVARSDIDTNGFGTLNAGATNALTFQIYLANTHVNGQLQPTEGGVPFTGVITNVPRQPGMILYIDRNIPDGKWALWDESALYNVQSLVKTTTYREEHIGGNGIYIRNWNGAIPVVAGRFKVLSGIKTP